MDTKERIQDQLQGNTVILYMKGSPDFPQCGFSAQTVAALGACETEFTTGNILEDPELREGLTAHSNWPTFPLLDISGELVGGCDITPQMYLSG